MTDVEEKLRRSELRLRQAERRALLAEQTLRELGGAADESVYDLSSVDDRQDIHSTGAESANSALSSRGDASHADLVTVDSSATLRDLTRDSA